MDNNNSLFIVVVIDEDGKKYEYEYGNIKHAKEQFNNEKHAFIYKYNKGKYHFVEAK